MFDALARALARPLVGLACVLPLFGCPARPAAAGVPDWPSQDAGAGTGGFVPYLSGEMFRTYVPGGTRYLNDHTVIQDPMSGLWHVIGITYTDLGNPFEETSFLHATAPSLLGPWTELPDALAADTSAMEGCCVWAPHIIALPPGSSAPWMMIYATEAGGLRRATSTDLTTWRRVAADEDATTRPPGGRDPFLIQIDTSWLVYSVGVAPIDANNGLGQIVYSSTQGDPSIATDWSPPVVVTTDPAPSYPWGNLESPTVVPYQGQYYLFTTRTGNDDLDYFREVVLRSPDPTNFAWQPVTEMPAHASEVVRDGDQLYLTSAGWTMMTGELNRGLLLAPIQWAAR